MCVCGGGGGSLGINRCSSSLLFSPGKSQGNMCTLAFVVFVSIIVILWC